jgi:hypothetical protein
VVAIDEKPSGLFSGASYLVTDALAAWPKRKQCFELNSTSRIGKSKSI